MGWTPLSAASVGDLIRFLGPREAYCTAFTEKLVRDGHADVPAATHRVITRRAPDRSIDGAILQSRNGLYYPVLSDTACTVEAQAVELLRKNSRRIYSIMGRTQDVNALEQSLPRPPGQAIEYHLMAQDSVPAELPLSRVPEDLEIRLSAPRDASVLAEIQRLYEIEEVLLPGNVFDAQASLNHLRHTLTTQMIIHATLNGKPVAKAGTNARGLFYDQIGGVFTHPDLRGRGIGTALMLRLLSLIAAANKSGTLFVKTDNGPAITMYNNLGFRVLDGFRISYYR